jgi:tetratricopeptide (TPR) repeat protein
MRTLVRLFRSALAPLIAALLVVLPLAAPAYADEKLDALFAQLREAPDAITANRIDRAIWAEWTNPPDPELAMRMRDVLVARYSDDIAGALALLDQLVVDYPDYAEGWNQRATIRYMIGELELSLEDCAKVLELEPRHFGALSGRAIIYLQLGRRALALKDMAAALAVHPFLSERRMFPEFDKPAGVNV